MALEVNLPETGPCLHSANHWPSHLRHLPYPRHIAVAIWPGSCGAESFPQQILELSTPSWKMHSLIHLLPLNDSQGKEELLR